MGCHARRRRAKTGRGDHTREDQIAPLIMAASPKPFVVEFKIEDSTRIQSHVRIGSPISKDNATGKLRLTTWDTDFTAIWDTGAPFTLVVPRVVQTASLKQRGFRKVGGIGSAPKQRPAYPASVVLRAPNAVNLQFIDVTMLEDDNQLGGADRVRVSYGIDSRGFVH